MKFFFFRRTTSRNLKPQNQDSIFTQEGENTFFKQKHQAEAGKESPFFPSQAKATASPVVQAKCESCMEDQQAEETLQAKGETQATTSHGPASSSPIQETSTSAKQPSTNLEQQLDANEGNGEALPEETQMEMENAFGQDFSGVNIHTGADAEDMNTKLGAKAFTHGSDIYFNKDQYNPGSKDGKRLLAHELTHVVQQRGTQQKENLVQRDIWDYLVDRIGDWTDSRPREALIDELEELQSFIDENYAIINHHPATGLGLFDAFYSPKKGVLDINMKIHFDFQPGDIQTWRNLQNSSTIANAATEQDFEWTQDEQDLWTKNTLSIVKSAWQDKYVFQSTKPVWKSLLRPIHVHININQTPKKNAHYIVKVTKWPTEIPKRDSVRRPKEDKPGTAKFFESGNNGITKPDTNAVRIYSNLDEYKFITDLNPEPIYFEEGASDVAPEDIEKLKEFGKALGLPKSPPFQIKITGYANNIGNEKDNRALSYHRASNVSNILVNAGAKTQPIIKGRGEEGATDSPMDRKVYIDIENLDFNQTVAVHEFGHMFGLDDEYPEKDERNPGDEVGHSGLVKKLMPEQEMVIASHNHNVMSAGGEVKPFHYVTFLEALGIMTDMEGFWKIGPGMGTHEFIDSPIFPQPPKEKRNFG